MKITLASPEQTVAAGAAVGAAVAGWWATAKDVALELFGVPLPVVLACATASYGALSFVSGMGYGRTLAAGLLWTLVGTYGARGALYLIAWATGAQVPEAALTMAGMAVSGLGPWVVTRDNVQRLRDAVGRRLDNLWKGGPS